MLNLSTWLKSIGLFDKYQFKIIKNQGVIMDIFKRYWLKNKITCYLFLMTFNSSFVFSEAITGGSPGSAASVRGPDYQIGSKNTITDKIKANQRCPSSWINSLLD